MCEKKVKVNFILNNLFPLSEFKSFLPANGMKIHTWLCVSFLKDLFFSLIFFILTVLAIEHKRRFPQ